LLLRKSQNSDLLSFFSDLRFAEKKKNSATSNGKINFFLKSPILFLKSQIFKILRKKNSATSNAKFFKKKKAILN